MAKITPLMVIGIVILIDGIGSFIYFKTTGTLFEQTWRLIRAGIGLFILVKRRRLR